MAGRANEGLGLSADRPLSRSGLLKGPAEDGRCRTQRCVSRPGTDSGRGQRPRLARRGSDGARRGAHDCVASGARVRRACRPSPVRIRRRTPCTAGQSHTNRLGCMPLHFRFQLSSFAAAASGGDGLTMLLELDSRGEMSSSKRWPGFCT